MGQTKWMLPLFLCVLGNLFSIKAAALNVAQKPLFLSNSSIPNVVLMLDDSGSMDWDILTVNHFEYCAYWQYSNCNRETTDGLYYSNRFRQYYYLYASSDNVYSSKTIEDNYPFGGLWDLTSTAEFVDDGTADWRIFSKDFNVLYFDPDQVYTPWSSNMNDADFEAAKSHPESSQSGYSVSRNLTGSFYAVYSDTAGFNGNYPQRYASSFSSTPNNRVDFWDDHTMYQIKASSIDRWEISFAVVNGVIERSVQSLPSITDAGEVQRIKQNFANWYQYYRRRSFSMNNAIANLLNETPNYRYALGVINQNNLQKGLPSDNSNLSAHNEELLESLFSNTQQGLGTPLRRGLKRVGDYLSQPGSSAPITESCQQNFSILFSDGQWTGGNTGVPDSDGDRHSYNLNGVTHYDTVADIAHWFYTNDLRSDLADNVPASSADSATYQHMSTFTVAFGIQGNLTDSDGDGVPESGGVALTESSPQWGNPFVGADREAHRINDLWHAAFNSKGVYTSAATPDEVAQGLSDALAEVDKRVGSSASVATNSGSLRDNTRLYQARFNSANWSGDLWAIPLGSDGSVGTTQDWKAAELLDARQLSGRVVVAADDVNSDPNAVTLSGVAFQANSLSQKYQDKLLAGKSALGAAGQTDDSYVSALVSYLRGESAASLSGFDFRTRSSRLGDFVHSDPTYTGAPSSSYTDNDYGQFRATYSNRDPMIYVGGNDGMLHGFDAQTGEERLAFIPYSVAGNLYHLADTSYEHRYFVDGQQTTADVCTGTGTCSWKTLLAGSLRGGGKAVYALDVTNPATFTESHAGNIFLWEFSDQNDQDMGLSFGKPLITKLNSDQWVVITANGYNSADGKAVLFILDAATGLPLSIGGKLDTQSGSSLSPNGLSSPTAIDTDQDGDTDYIYAGDLKGNVWKFDLSSSDAADWGVAYTQNGSPAALFSLSDSQPITVAPAVSRHPSQSGFMVYFGTGQYIEINDNIASGQATQGFYGVWDSNVSNGDFEGTLSQSDLLRQTITREITVYPIDTNGDGVSNSSDMPSTYRLISSNEICWSDCTGDSHKGWYLELALNGDNRGEKQVTRPILRNGRVIFTTFMPSSSSCDNGGQSWLMELGFADGSSVSEPPFDVNNDGEFTEADNQFGAWTSADISDICPEGQCPPPGGVLQDGIVQAPAIINCTTGTECKYLSGSGGDVNLVNENPGMNSLGRQSWRLLKD